MAGVFEVEVDGVEHNHGHGHRDDASQIGLSERSPEDKWRLEHAKMHAKHKGHEAMHAEMVLILIVTLVIAQLVLVQWKQRHPKSYNSHITRYVLQNHLLRPGGHLVCPGGCPLRLVRPGGCPLRLIRPGGLPLRLIRPGGLPLCLIRPGGLPSRLLRPGGFLSRLLRRGPLLRRGSLLRHGSLCSSSAHMDLALHPSPCLAAVPPPF